MNIVSAEKDDLGRIAFTSMRNVYLPISDVEEMDLSEHSHIDTDEGVFLVGEDAFVSANVFNQQVLRPMKSGLIDPESANGLPLEIIQAIIKSVIGTGKSKEDICCFSVPENYTSMDKLLYHTNILKSIIERLGFTAIPMNEALAIIYTECKKSAFTGLAISAGAGMVNTTLAFKGKPIISFATNRSGDWIDENVATVLGIPSNRISKAKENPSFDLNDSNFGLSTSSKTFKKDFRVREAISHYYKEMVSYTMRTLETELKKVTTEFPTEIPIILSGGTSKMKGVTEAFISFLGEEAQLPFEVSEVRVAQDQLNAVAEGCLIKAMTTIKK
jgi:hypothetical protein